MQIAIQKAVPSDAEKLTEIMKRTFDAEAAKWLSNRDTIDYNIQPPGYASVNMTNYMIEELVYYKILWDEEIVGGLILTLTGTSFGRIDRIYVDPEYQGKKIGSRVIGLMEEEFPTVRMWDLETSSRQLNNHHFYEKMGFQTTYKSEEEYGYIKRTASASGRGNLFANKDLSNGQYENCQMDNIECYQAALENISISNSNLMKAELSNCNLSHSTFRNINFRHSSYADLNISNSKMRLVTLGGVRFLDTDLGDAKEPISFERCDLEGTRISNCNLRDLKISNSDIAGMTIDNIPVEELLELYKRQMQK
ncbi:ribosomal protein S18 acetylase RimI-like enzyme [Sporosarcina luteola]|nr:ribosomal protein S18 acetylase RimI-like enzyme [Sporosarcina luteola]